MNEIPLTAALCDYDHVRDLVMGRVNAQGIRLTALTLPVEEIFYRFLFHKEWEISELSFAKYTSLRASGDDSFVAIPVFPSRVFRHSSLFVRDGGPIKNISDLKGRKVGLPEWAQTAAVYSRGFLVDQFGLDLTSIEWVQSGVNQAGRKEKVQLNLPRGLKLTPRPERSLNDMLLDGEIDAVLAARPPTAFSEGDKRIKRFFDDTLEVEQAYYRETGVFPIMHAVVIRKHVLEANPWVARNLMDAFEEAKVRSIERTLDATASLVPIPWGAEYARRMHEMMGSDFFPYGVENNRRTLESFLAHAFAQGVTKRHLSVEELFPASTMGGHKV